jgi:hypothetical protein
MLNGYNYMDQQLPSPYWMTRDQDAAGQLSELVDVWSVPPEFQPLPGGVGSMWLGKGVTGLEFRVTQWTMGDIRLNVPSGTYPESGRETIRVG